MEHMTNVCDLKNLEVFNRHLDDCIGGFKEGIEAMVPLLEKRIALGRKLAAHEGDIAKKLKSELQIKATAFTEIYDGKKKKCSKGHIPSCGFISFADQFEHYFGPISGKREKLKPKKVALKPQHSGWLIVDGHPKSKRQEFLLDTGATLTFLSPEFAARSMDHLDVVGRDSNIKVAIYRNKSLELRPFGRSFKPSLVSETGVVGMLEGTDESHDLVAILGAEFLFPQPWRVDHDDGAIYFDEDVEKILSGGNWSVEEVKTHQLSIGYALSVFVHVNGLEIPLLIDTGAAGSFLLNECAKDIPSLKISSSALQLEVTGLYEVGEARGVSYMLGTTTAMSNRVAVKYDYDGNTAMMMQLGLCGVVGTDILRQLDYMYDPGTLSLYVRPRDKPSMLRSRRPLGMAVAREDGEAVITEVGKEGFAAEAGIEKGDKIVSIDGKKAESWSIMEILELDFYEKDDFDIEVSRSGKAHKFTIKRD